MSETGLLAAEAWRTPGVGARIEFHWTGDK